MFETALIHRESTHSRNNMHRAFIFGLYFTLG
jgi:hypothetical protein